MIAEAVNKMHMKVTTFCLVFIGVVAFLGATPARSQGERALRPDIVRYVENGVPGEMALYDGSYALVIGMSNYREWPRLEGPKSDVEAVKEVLKEQGFVVQVEQDLTGEELERKIRQFIKTYGLNEKRRIIIYFAGHGHTVRSPDGRELGYIVPIDAPVPAKADDTAFKQVALSMTSVKGFADEIQTKHSLFIFDSCFSGLLTRANDRIVPPSIAQFLDNPSRHFITSGSGTETVSDVSTFRRYFVSGLRGDADTNTDGYILGTELFQYLYKRIKDESKGRQTPQFGKIDDENLRYGDMVFLLKRNTADTSEDKLWQEAQAENSVRSYTIFLSTYGGGKYRNQALAAFTAAVLKAAPAQQNTVAPVTSGGNRSAPVALQAAPFEFSTATIDDGGVASNAIKMTSDAVEEDLGGVKIKLVRIPAGKFLMGSEKQLDEKPAHAVVIPEFYMGVFEVTKKQWEAVARMPKKRIQLPKDPSGTAAGDNLPVTNITWEEAQEFCERLSSRTGRNYTLPTESEWEYAARGGIDAPFGFGGKINSNFANFNAEVINALGIKGHYRKKLVDVGSLGYANKFGIFDAHGNVAEWCLDGWADTYENAPTDGSARPGNASKKVVRGGSFDLTASRICSSCRSSAPADLGSDKIGFRVVMHTAVFATNP